jgi:hypothetical protein
MSYVLIISPFSGIPPRTLAKSWATGVEFVLNQKARTGPGVSPALLALANEVIV